MQIDITLNKEKKNYPIYLMLIFTIVVYPLVYQLFPGSSTMSALNKVVLITLVALFIYTVMGSGIRCPGTLENKLFTISFVYILFSLLVYSNELGIGGTLQEAGYSVIPFLLYFVVFGLTSVQKKQYIQITFFSLFFVIVVGLLAILDLIPLEQLNEAAKSYTGGNFDSYYSPILMGYVSQFMFSITLFDFTFSTQVKKHKMIFLVLFFIVSIITLQRAAYLGLLTSMLFYFISKKGKNHQIHTNYNKIIAEILLVIILTLVLLICMESIEKLLERIFPFGLWNHISDELKDFNIGTVIAQRSKQQVIFEKNILTFFIGEGFGKYSSSNTNPLTIAIDDASFFRIFNELGLIGTVLFYLPFVILFIKAVVKKKFFAMYFIFQTMIAFLFNRVLWLIPISYFIYPMFNFIMDEKLKRSDE